RTCCRAKRRSCVRLDAGRCITLRVALVEQGCNLVGVELRLRLLRWFLRWQRLLFGFGLLWLVGLFELFGDRVRLRRRLGRRRGFFCGLQFFFLGDLGLSLFDRLRRLLRLFLDQWLRGLDLGRVLDAFGHLREILFADEVDRQRFRRRHVKALAGKR